MVEREAQIAARAPARRVGDLQPAASRASRSGIDATIRFATNNWTKPLTQSQLALDSPYNTRTHQGLPPGPIGSPGLACDPGGRGPAAHALPLLRGQAGHVRRARLLGHATRSSSATWSATTASANAAAASRRPTADGTDAAGSRRLPRRPQPLAGDAQRGARGARPGLALRAAARAARAVRRDRERAARVGLPRAST